MRWLVILGLLGGLATGAQAQVPICCRWESSVLGEVTGGPDIVVEVNPTGFNLPPEVVVSYVQWGLDVWNASGTSFRFVLGPVVTETSPTAVPLGRVRVLGYAQTGGSWGDTLRRTQFFYYDLGPPPHLTKGCPSSGKTLQLKKCWILSISSLCARK